MSKETRQCSRQLKSIMALNGYDCEELAGKMIEAGIEISAKGLNKRMNETLKFDIHEIKAILSIFEKTFEEVFQY